MSVDIFSVDVMRVDDLIVDVLIVDDLSVNDVCPDFQNPTADKYFFTDIDCITIL